MQLRPYQRDAIDCLWAYMNVHNDNPCLVLPTGAGKSPLMAGIAHEALTQWPGTRVLVLAHVRELVQQNAEKLLRYWPEAPVGIYSASLGKRDRFQPVVFASIQSVHDKAMLLGRFDLILVDEAHRIPTKGEGMYRAFLAECQRINPALRIAGLTATPYRLGSGVVCGPDHILNTIAYEIGVRELIDGGYLSRLVSKAGLARANLSGVHIRGSEYVATELAKAVNQAELVKLACIEIMQFCTDRRAWVVFCADVAHANAVSAELKTHGVDAPVVEGGTNSAERASIVRRFTGGQLRALCNVNVLSEGFDAPHVDAVILMRPTKSAGLYYQQVGRGLRLAPGKSDCLILDFAGNALEHGPIDEIRIQRPKRAGETGKVITMPTKECPQCQGIVIAMVATCPDCGHEWPRQDAKHDPTASFAPVLSTEIDLSDYTHEFEVTDVLYDRHEKPGGIPSLKVTYVCGFRTFREWVCVEHSGMARSRACDWWRKRMPARIGDHAALVPRTVDSALALTHHLLKAARIKVLDRGGKHYPEILSHELEPDSEPSGEGAHGGAAASDAPPPGSAAGKPQLPWLRGV